MKTDNINIVFIEYLEREAKKGHVPSQLNLGFLYAKGVGVPEHYDEAIKWLRKSAGQENAGVENKSDFLYVKDRAVPEKGTQAEAWLLAAEQWIAEAQYFIGLAYIDGKSGVPSNYSEAYIWLSLSAANGFDSAAKERDEIKERMSMGEIKKAQDDALERMNQRRELEKRKEEQKPKYRRPSI